MYQQDPIADMLTRVRNAQAAQKAIVGIPSSKMKVGIAHVLKEEGYIADYRVEGDEKKPTLVLDLKYYEGKPVIASIKRVSKCSRRVYSGSGKMPKVLGGLGTLVISTSQGIMSDKAARAKNIGGEILCEVA